MDARGLRRKPTGKLMCYTLTAFLFKQLDNVAFHARPKTQIKNTVFRSDSLGLRWNAGSEPAYNVNAILFNYI
jgi:hypothetical protein